MGNKYNLGSRFIIMHNNKIEWGQIISMKLIKGKVKYIFSIETDVLCGSSGEYEYKCEQCEYFEDELDYDGEDELLEKLKLDFQKRS